MLAESFGDQFGALHLPECKTQARWQLAIAHRPALLGGQGPDVVLGFGAQRIVLLDAPQTGGQQHRERQVRVARRIGTAHLDPTGGGLARGVHRHPDQCGAVRRSPGRRRRRLAAVHQPLVGVHPLVGHRADLAGVLEDAGDERLGHVGELQRVLRAVEGVGLALEQTHMGVHGRAGILRERLGHERGAHTLTEGHLLDQVPKRHDVVGHRQCVRVAQVDLLLSGRPLVVTELDRDTHLLEGVDGVPAEVGCRIMHGLVEVAAVVGGHRDRTVVGAGLEEEELDLRMHVAGEPQIAGFGQLPAKHVAAVGPRRRTIRHGDIAEHPRRVVLARARCPRQHLERRRIGADHHVGFRHPGETLDRGAVEADALLESALQFGRRDGDGLEETQHVGEPQPDESDIAFLQRAKHEFLLPVHDASVGSGC